MKRDASPSARTLLALETIEGAPGITAERLGDRLGVSERAARRYVEVLREAGIPIDSLRGPYGGYRTGRGLRLPPLMFSGAEALGLVMAVLDGHHQAADAADPAGSALGKIVRALPEPVAASVDAVRRSAAAAPDRAAARPHPATAAAIVQASAERRRVRMEYRSEAGSAWAAEIDPWAVVVRHGRWYVLCFAHSVGAQRAYRIDRIGAVDVLDVSFEPRADLDPIVMLEEHLATGWEYDVEVVLEAPIETVGRAVPRALGRLEELSATRCRLVGSTSNPTWYAAQLAGIPMPYRVVGGPEVREAVLALGRRAVAACRRSRRSPQPTASGLTERDR